MSALLEAHESLPFILSSSSKGNKKLRKVHAEAHFALTASSLRTSFSLDIPSDATPSFQCGCSQDGSMGSSGRPEHGPGGLEWKVRLCLLVSVASPYAREGYDGIRMKHLIVDGERGEWGSAWRATKGIAPLQNIDTRKADAAAAAALARGEQQGQNSRRGGWTSYIFSSLLSGEREYHDGDEDVDSDVEPDAHSAGEGIVIDPTTGEVDVGGGEHGWSELRVETVECEVPIGIWPGNTAFKPMEVVFSV